MRWPARWRDPSTVALVRNTPINCLVLDWARSEGRTALFPLIERGRRDGLMFAGLTDAKTDKADADASATAAGLSALILPDPPTGSDVPLIPLVDRSGVRRRLAGPVLAVTGNVWPRVRLSPTGSTDSADAGPTGIPWVDSNGWFIRVAKTLAPAKPIWVFADPPAGEGTAPAESYVRAAADTAVSGGRWVVSLHDELAAALARGDGQALSTWKRITGTLSFFEKHREWLSYQPAGLLAVLSDFSGPNQFLSTETVNLLSRRHLPFRLVDKSNPAPAAVEGLKAILYTDQDPPPPSLRKTLDAWVEAGGLLISPIAGAGLASGLQPSGQAYARFRFCTLGKGHVAAGREDVTDPFVLATDAHTLLSRTNDLVRAFNAGTTNSFCLTSPDGRRSVVHIVNYVRQPAKDISLLVRAPYGSARFWTLESERPVPLKPILEGGERELRLPPIPVYAAVELEK